MRKDGVNLNAERRVDKEEKRGKTKKFSWNWFRHRRKDNKIDRRAQIDKDMKDNWTELPTTLKRKQKMSQEILDEFMKDPSEPDMSSSSSNHSSTSSKPEAIYSQVKKIKQDLEKSIGESSLKVEERLVIEDEVTNEEEIRIENETTDAEIDELYNLNDYEDIRFVKTDEIHVEKVDEFEIKTTEEIIKLELPQTDDAWLEKEEQVVVQMLNHAVSEDSLLVVSTASEASSSEDEIQDDSGTDINNPSSSSSCNNEPITVVNPIDPLSIINSHIKSVVKSELYSNYEVPIKRTHGEERVIPIIKIDDLTNCDSEVKTSSDKSDSLLTTSEDSLVNGSDSTIPANVLFQNADQEVEELKDDSLDLYDMVVPMSIPRAELHMNSRNKNANFDGYKTDEESVLEYYDSVVREGQKGDHSFQVEVEVYREDKERSDDVRDRLRDERVDDDGDEKHLSMEFIVEEDFSKIVDQMQFTTGTKWKKALLMQTLGRKPKGMATIIEESSLEEETTPEQLTVREILKRFEELGCQMLPAEEKSATLKEIYVTLKCLEEKVRCYETQLKTKQQTSSATASNAVTMIQQKSPPRITADAYHQQQQQPQQPHNGKASADWGSRHLAPAAAHQHPAPAPTGMPVQRDAVEPAQSQHDGKHSLLQFAMHHFRASPEKFEMLKTADGSISGSLKVIESLKSNKKKAKKDKEKEKEKTGSANKENDWTWKEQVDLVKFTSVPVEMSLLRLDTPELSDLAVECFASVMRYMGDLPMSTDLSEVKCVYTILMHCHKHESLRDEVYCQLMKQTTNNKSANPDSCQRGWRLFSIVAAYFICSDMLKPYLFKYLETAAYDKRRAYHGTATVCLQNLRKTFRHGGRKNVPSVEELTAISAGRNSKRQIYQLPGGSERVVNTKSTTVVQDVIEEMCAVINVQAAAEMEEFSLYCIVEGDTFTMPLARDEYILDVTTELHKNQQVFYLIFCRSVWHFPLRLDSQLYIEVVFNQIAPDYLEGLLLVMPGEQLEQDVIYDIAKMATLLHRAADMTHLPTMKETKFLLPKPALAVRDVKPGQWVNMVQGNWREVEPLQTIQAKAQVLEILSKWPLFGSSFFAVKRISEPKERAEHILALNRHGVHFIDLVTHETLMHYTFSEVISTRKVKSEDGTLFLDMKCGNLMQQRITRLQTDQAHEISRLIRQYITMEQKLRP